MIKSMRKTWITALVALIVSAPAVARPRTIAPPGNSGVSQYVESIPTAAGGRPTSTITPSGGGGGGGRRDRPTSTITQSGGGGGGGRGGSSALSPANQAALVRQGSDGVQAAALARATAPAKTAAASHRGAVTGVRPHAPVAAGSGPSPATALVKALTGSASGGGLGPLLPVILVVSAVGAGLLALRRRRAT